MKLQSDNHNTNYGQLKRRILLRCLFTVILSVSAPFWLYYLWRGRISELIVRFFQFTLLLSYEDSCLLYRRIFRDNFDVIWIGTMFLFFLLLMWFVINWLTKYFDIVIRGIDDLLLDDVVICLPSEMMSIEHKLNAVKLKLKQRTLEAQLAEQRKNDLVMYLAHDIRTPLTSVIGYLNLLSETPDMPPEQRTKYVNITLDKAYRLEKMINEFFEITRYNLQQIQLSNENIDLYYMLVQLSDELSPLLLTRGNTTVLKADENLTVCGDPDKLARVFQNVLKNAAAYSFPNTEILITAAQENDNVVVSVQNQGNTIPKEQLDAIFEKFYRPDESRASNTGGSGLGLAIAREIVSLHGGTIQAFSENNLFTIVITLSAAS
ncbi:MAG: HAMP domain-containing histidine kinase [Acetatifactor muris]|nr:HAMP domain-containing histidine kinase [Acetatifactor muris]MCM1525712.1 HAMP domain-containing histidine kinase [Bacteroides sp.]